MRMRFRREMLFTLSMLNYLKSHNYFYTLKRKETSSASNRDEGDEWDALKTKTSSKVLAFR
jgi:hypothetical protein